MYKGALNDCFFEPDKALCRPTNTTEFNEPILAHCKVSECSCSLIDQSKMREWEDKQKDLLKLSENYSLEDYQETFICGRLNKVNEVLLQIQPLGEKNE